MVEGSMRSFFQILKVFMTGAFLAVGVLITLGVIYLAYTAGQFSSWIMASDIQTWVQQCVPCKQSGDILSYALQLGRLDFISFGLTVLGILLAVFAFTGLWIIRREALEMAKETAQKEVNAYMNSQKGQRQIDMLVYRHTRSRDEDKLFRADPYYDAIARELWDNEEEEPS